MGPLRLTGDTGSFLQVARLYLFFVILALSARLLLLFPPQDVDYHPQLASSIRVRGVIPLFFVKGNSGFVFVFRVFGSRSGFAAALRETP